VALIHDVTFDFSLDASAVATTSLCIEPRLLVSARLRPLRAADLSKATVHAGHVFRSPAIALDAAAARSLHAHFVAWYRELNGTVINRSSNVDRP
jgi:hypothetical protein